MGISRKILNLFLVLLVLLCTFFITETFASVEYYNNGNPQKIVTDKGTITYYLNGNVESIVTPEGTAKYNLDGGIGSIEGNPSISLEEAKAELNKLQSQSTSKQVDSSLPNTGVESSYLLLIPVLAVIILFSLVKLKKLKNM